MKKIIFYIPAILFSVIYSWLALLAIGKISSIVFIWLALFFVTAILLHRNKFWGGFFGMLPGVHLIYMSTIDTGQVINIEFPTGMAVIIFYFICIIFVFFEKNKIRH